MGNSYQRQDVSNNIANGNIINADDLDAEFNALEGAFTAVTGHSHDGTAGEGGPISQVGPAQDLIVSASQVLPKTDNTLDLGSASFEFKDLWIDGTANIDNLVADTGTFSGDVGIGTPSVAGIFGRTLQIGDGSTAASISLLGTGAGTTGDVFLTSSANTATLASRAATDLILATGDVERMRVASAGNVGVGTTNPLERLHINTASGAAGIRLSVLDVSYGNLFSSASGTTLSNITAAPLIFSTTNTERMRIAADGAVAIGTSTTPSYANFGSLTMDGTQGSGIDLRRAGALEGEIFLANTGKLTLNSSGAAAEFRVNMNGTNRFKVDPNGNAALNGAFSLQAGDTVFAINSDTQDANLRMRYLDSTVAVFRTQQNLSAFLGTDIAVPMRLGVSNTTVIRIGGTSQNVSIGRGNADGDAAAVVDIGGTTKGLLIPRLSTTQRNAIASVPTGLLVYNTTLNQLEHFNGTVWGPVGSAPSNLTTSEFAAATLVTAAEGINSNNNDTTIPTSAAVKAYADTAGVPAGAVMSFAMSTAPTGWLKANGVAVSRTTYAALFAAIGTTYGVGDGSTTFNLPDMRGEFARGWDDARGVDSGRAIGSTQAQAIESHTHSVTDPGHNHTIQTVTGTAGSSGVPDASAARVTAASTRTASGWTNVTQTGISGGELRNVASVTGLTVNAAGGTETRPRNVALLYCIKF